MLVLIGLVLLNLIYLSVIYVLLLQNKEYKGQIVVLKRQTENMATIIKFMTDSLNETEKKLKDSEATLNLLAQAVEWRKVN